MTSDEEDIVQRGLRAIRQLKRYRSLDFYEPYPKQLDFHQAGAQFSERAIIAGNQVGKSHCACAETAMHLTGDYPDWWKGKRFSHPIAAWTAGPNAEKVRDVLQTKLFGHYAKPEEFGTGYIPKDAILGRPSLARGVTFAYDTGQVRWQSPDGRLDESAISTLTFKSYTEGVLAFASDTIDLYHGDEESAEDIYTECRVRLQVKKGISYTTLTPLLGWTPLITMLMKGERCHITRMGLYDAKHYTKEQADDILAGFPEYIRMARGYGDPALGEGRVFMEDEGSFKVARMDFVPLHWAKLWGIDFGGTGSGSHPFGAALVAWDRDTDVMYLVKTIKMQGATMLQHVPALRAVGAGVPVAWPHDGNEKDRGGSGLIIAEQYKMPFPGMPGLLMLPEHSTWPGGGYSTEAAVSDLDDRIKTGRFRAFSDCLDFFDEYRQYHREKGLIVKVNDDILSGLYKCLMMKRYAKAGPLGDSTSLLLAQRPLSGQSNPIDPFTGREIKPY